ncbi:MAG: tetratricopeptide repeat protein [Verrucomicrobiae bacterium]
MSRGVVPLLAILLVLCGARAPSENVPTKSDGKGAEKHRKAAEQGDAVAQLLLGVCYGEGKGVAKDAAEAVKWVRKAAEQGLAIAQDALERCYATGKGVCGPPGIGEFYNNQAFAARRAAHRAFMLAASFARTSGLTFRFFFALAGLAALGATFSVLFAARRAAQRAFVAAEMRARPSRLIVRFLALGGLTVFIGATATGFAAGAGRAIAGCDVMISTTPTTPPLRVLMISA